MLNVHFCHTNFTPNKRCCSSPNWGYEVQKIWPALALCPVCRSLHICSVFARVSVRRAGTSPCLRRRESGMGLSLAVVVRLSLRNEACCFIGQAKLLRQGFCWRFEFCQSQMELHNMFNPWGYKEALYESIGGKKKNILLWIRYFLLKFPKQFWLLEVDWLHYK